MIHFEWVTVALVNSSSWPQQLGNAQPSAVPVNWAVKFSVVCVDYRCAAAGGRLMSGPAGGRGTANRRRHLDPTDIESSAGSLAGRKTGGSLCRC